MAVETQEAVYVNPKTFTQVCNSAGWQIKPMGGDVVIVIGNAPTDNTKGVTLCNGDTLVNNQGGSVYAKSLTANFADATRIEVITW